MTSTAPTDPRRDTADQVEHLWGFGWTVRQIAKSLDISTQRVYQIRDDRGLEEKKGSTVRRAGSPTKENT